MSAKTNDKKTKQKKNKMHFYLAKPKICQPRISSTNTGATDDISTLRNFPFCCSFQSFVFFLITTGQFSCWYRNRQEGKERKNENSIRINSEVHCKTVYQDWYIQPEQNQIYSTRYKRNYVVREELFVQFLVAPASNPEAKYSFSYD